MQPDGGAAGLEDLHVLCEQPHDHPRKHVAAPRRRQVRRSIGVDHGAAVNGSDDRVGALQQQRRAARSRRLANTRRLVAGGAEQPGELPLVGGQQTGTGDGVEQRVRVVAEDRQRIRVEDTRPSGCQRRQHPLTGLCRHPRSRPQQQGVLALVGDQCLESGVVGDRCDDRSRPSGRIDADRFGGRGNGDQPGPDAPGAFGRQPCGAGHLAAAEDQSVPTAVFVAARCRPWEPLLPEPGPVDEGLRGDVRQNRMRYADVGNDQVAAKRSSGQQQVAGLRPEERHGQDTGGGGAEDFPAIAVNPAGHVDGDTIEAAAVDRFDHARGHAFQRPRQPGAEQGIDHQRIAVEKRHLQWPNTAVPACGVDRRVAFQLFHRPQEAQSDRPPLAGQQPGDDETVAAVVAGAAKHGDRPGPPPSADFPGDGASRGFHQFDSGDTAGHRGGVRLVHLFDG